MFNADLKTFLLDTFMGSWQFLSLWDALLRFPDNKQTCLHSSWWKRLLPQHPGARLRLQGSLCPLKGARVRMDFLSWGLLLVHREALWSLILTPLGLQVELKCHLPPTTRGWFSLLWPDALVLRAFHLRGTQFGFSECCPEAPMAT